MDRASARLPVADGNDSSREYALQLLDQARQRVDRRGGESAAAFLRDVLAGLSSKARESLRTALPDAAYERRRSAAEDHARLVDLLRQADDRLHADNALFTIVERLTR
jgi:hypothetical protein